MIDSFEVLAKLYNDLKSVMFIEAVEVDVESEALSIKIFNKEAGLNNQDGSMSSVVLKFENFIHYSVTMETNSSPSLLKREEYGRSLIKMNNSTILDSRREFLRMASTSSHYSFNGANYIVDVISDCEPSIKTVKK